MKRPRSRWIYVFAFGLTSIGLGQVSYSQKPGKKPPRAEAPKFRPGEFSDVFFADPVALLQGSPPGFSTVESMASSPSSESGPNTAPLGSKGNDSWKQLISAPTIEDLVKESKSRIDSVITSPAKFAGGGYADSRREFTLLASLMAVISQYPEEIRWKNSAPYARTIFARLASNCKVGSQQVYNEAKLRQQDLQEMLKGSKLSGNAEEIAWADTADRGPTMKLLEWTLRDHLAPQTSSDSNFNDNLDEIVKYAELLSVLNHILEQDGMTDADDKAYVQWVQASIQASRDVVKAVQNKDAEMARVAVSRIDQACNKCHETYR